MRKIIITSLVVFVALFVSRFLYGYTKKVENPNQFQFAVNANESFNLSVRKNYASKKYSQVDNTSVQLDQKYEKVAEISSSSINFNRSEKKVRKFVKDFNALIQFEHKSGNVGNRNMKLVIGVPPEHFDDFYNELVKVGVITSKQITKNDKTNEYKELNAKKVSLLKLRNSLIELKSKGGNIEEYINLENRILDVEQQLQATGVNLGDFDAENEFCTINLSLKEIQKYHISIYQRVKVALDWTVKTFLKLSFALLMISVAGYLLTLIRDKYMKLRMK